MTINLDELKKLANAATHGTWIKTNWQSMDEPINAGVDSESGSHVAGTMEDHDAEYIAAANPQTVLALISELEEARKDAERLKEVLRVNPGRLEIRMSLESFHIAQFIPLRALNSAGDPAGIVEKHTRHMYQQLDEQRAASQQKG